MSAGKEISLNKSSAGYTVKKLGIVAGSGQLPADLVQACEAKGIECFVIGLKGFTDHVEPQFWGRIGGAGKIIHWLNDNKIHDLVLIGAIKRPGLFDLWPDWIMARLFFKAWWHSFGDSGLLSAGRQLLEEYGFRLHGAHEFLPDLLMPVGLLTVNTPKRDDYLDIQVGLKASQELGLADVGQAVIVKDGKIIGREDKRGTSALIKKHGVKGAILVKSCKPQQDRDLDLPTIGAQTVRLCVEKGMVGIAGQAGHTLLANKNAVVEIANQNQIFVLGIEINV